MLPNLRTLAVAGVVALGGLLGAGAQNAKAQLVVSTPGFALGVGAPVAPVVPAYPAYGVYPPAYAAGYAPYPVVRPYPYVYPRAFYGPRPYYGGYYRRGYRRW